MQTINPEILSAESVKRMKMEFNNATPYRHLAIENFLTAEYADSLFENFPDETVLRKHYNGLNEKKSEGSSFDQYHSDFARVRDDISTHEFLKFLEQITGIEGIVMPDDHRGTGLHKGINGSFLDVHVDFSIHPVLNLHRRLNLLIFLNKNWKKEYGGELELWDKDVKVCEKRFQPSFNRVVIFETSDYSYHGYGKITIPENESRKSFYAYYYSPITKEVKYHDTIFKARPSEGMVKKTQTAVKETSKNLIKKSLKKLGLEGVFTKFE